MQLILFVSYCSKCEEDINQEVFLNISSTAIPLQIACVCIAGQLILNQNLMLINIVQSSRDSRELEYYR